MQSRSSTDTLTFLEVALLRLRSLQRENGLITIVIQLQWYIHRSCAPRNHMLMNTGVHSKRQLPRASLRKGNTILPCRPTFSAVILGRHSRSLFVNNLVTSRQLSEHSLASAHTHPPVSSLASTSTKLPKSASYRQTKCRALWRTSMA